MSNVLGVAIATMRLTCAGSIAGLSLIVGIALPASDRAGPRTFGSWVIPSAWSYEPKGCISPQNAGAGFLRWLDSGGPDQAGLPRGSMDVLGRSTRVFLGDVVRLCSGTAAVADAWSRVSGLDDAALIAASPRLLNLLGTVNETGSAAMRSAVVNKIQVADALANVDRSIQADQRRQPGLQTELTQAQQRLQSARADLQNAQGELDGGKGFANGLLTGITFGAYNPLKENLDRARRSVDGINREIESINRQRELIAAAQQELEQKRQLLDVIGRMDLTVTDFQNVVNRAQDPLSRARENFEKSGGRDLPALAQLFLRRARAAMADLSNWVPTFNSVVRQLALGNRAPSMDCATTITGCKVTS
jgi:prefoldin subunit 5